MYFFRLVFQFAVNRTTPSLICELLLPNTLYWYLFALFYYYLFYFLVLKRVGEKACRRIYIISLCLTALMPCLLGRFSEAAYLYRLVFHFTFFLTGYFLMRQKEKRFERIQSATWLPYLAMLCLIIGVGWKTCLRFPCVRLIIVSTIILGLLSIVLTHGKMAKNRVVCYVGENSIYIYIIHNYITSALRMIKQRLDIAISPIPYIAFCLVFTAAMCLLIQQIVQKLWPLDVFFRPVRTLKRIRGKAS